MNRTRCPWCGKKIDKVRDTVNWADRFETHSVPRMLRIANCGHCRHKYGQVPVFRHELKIICIVVLVAILALFLRSGMLLVLAFTPLLFGLIFTPYSKLDDKGNVCEINTDLLCEFMIVQQYSKINFDELYFLNDSFDNFEPFVLASPIYIYRVSKKNKAVLGEFLYMHQKNYGFIQKDICDLYDTEMNLIAKIKFITKEHF